MAETWYALKDPHNPYRQLKQEVILTARLDQTAVGKMMLQFYDSDKTQISIPMIGAERMEWVNQHPVLSASLRLMYQGQVPDRTLSSL